MCNEVDRSLRIDANEFRLARFVQVQVFWQVAIVLCVNQKFRIYLRWCLRIVADRSMVRRPRILNRKAAIRLITAWCIRVCEIE